MNMKAGKLTTALIRSQIEIATVPRQAFGVQTQHRTMSPVIQQLIQMVPTLNVTEASIVKVDFQVIPIHTS